MTMRMTTKKTSKLDFAMTSPTADLYDQHADLVSVAEPIFADFGGRIAFHGPIATLKCYEDNSLVRQRLGEAGRGRVLVIDGGGSMNCALLGDQLAQLGVDNQWAGLVIFGCIRDSALIANMPLGVKALATTPRKSIKRDQGLIDIPISFAGITFEPGHYLYADEDGILTAPRELN